MAEISIITVCFNSQNTIKSTLDSIKTQTHENIQHIIIDGKSTDNTLEIINHNKINNSIILSESDNGIYDAMNKGFYLATGDLVYFLNSDDILADKDILKEISNTFEKNSADLIYGNIIMVNENNKVVRYWNSSNSIRKNRLRKQIPHPGLFIKRDIINKLKTPFDPSYLIAADLKQQLILLSKFNCTKYYLNKSISIMKIGGRSTGSTLGYILGWKESVRAYNEVYGSGGLIFTILKVLRKIPNLYTNS